MRDGAIRTTFEILGAASPDAWFGVYFRSGADLQLGSHLVYVQQNGSIEVAIYPGPHVVESFPSGQALSGQQTLTLEFENDHLDIQLGSAQFASDELSHQVAGRVLFAAWHADVDVISADMICRDTIEWA